ncbi:MAG: hypothetical protein R3B13_39150 [Polyangiaceae bacterium]
MTATRWLPVLLCALAATACGEGEPGDLALAPKPKGDILGDGLRLSQINDPSLPRPVDGSEVNVTGISVLAVDSFDETGDGASVGNIYAQDLPIQGAPPPYGGITLFGSSFNPPTLRVAPGDVVDVRGAYEEFPGPPSSLFDPGETLPEIVSGALRLRFEHVVPEPITIPLSDLASYATGRKWIGMLVRVENVSAQSDGFKSSSGRFSVRLDVPGTADSDLPTINNALNDIESAPVSFAAGTKYASVVGVVQYFFNFAIGPRSAADITP